MDSDCQFWWNWVVNLLIAIATFSAVVVALWGDKIRFRFFRPKLMLTLRNTIGEITGVQYDINNNGVQQHVTESARYYHLNVINQSRWSISNQTQVFLQRIEQPGPDGFLQIIYDNEVPMEWRHQSIYPLERTIGPSALIDICSVGESGWIRLHPNLVPSNLNVVYRTQTNLVLTFQAKGNESESPIIRIRIVWDGIWEEGETEMTHHFVIKDITGEI